MKEKIEDIKEEREGTLITKTLRMYSPHLLPLVPRLL